jgi:phosphatidylglycerol---prolipoprotein diacylglyceryl transferase
MTFFPSRTVLLDIQGFSLHWYGMMYLFAFLLAMFLLPRLQRYRSIYYAKEEWANILSAAILGVIIGGRLGYVIIYDPLYFASSPLEIVAVWHGGMSSHGGFIGVWIALYYLFRKRNKGELLALGDISIVPIAIGIALGRIGNFINQELFGIPTDLPWGMSVPGIDALVHPTQIYAVLTNLSIASICFFNLTKTQSTSSPGRTLGLFLVLYSLSRFFLEYLRFQEFPLIDLQILLLSYGQILTIPVLLVGLYLLWKIGRHSSR